MCSSGEGKNDISVLAIYQIGSFLSSPEDQTDPERNHLFHAGTRHQAAKSSKRSRRKPDHQLQGRQNPLSMLPMLEACSKGEVTATAPTQYEDSSCLPCRSCFLFIQDKAFEPSQVRFERRTNEEIPSSMRIFRLLELSSTPCYHFGYE